VVSCNGVSFARPSAGFSPKVVAPGGGMSPPQAILDEHAPGRAQSESAIAKPPGRRGR
jgi:hypothetical protein